MDALSRNLLRPPPTRYSRKSGRSSAALSSSPTLGVQDDEDVPLGEMVSRMKKRSRNVLKRGVDMDIADNNKPVLKKNKVNVGPFLDDAGDASGDGAAAHWHKGPKQATSTGSRNLKENAASSAHRGLASPFRRQASSSRSAPKPPVSTRARPTILPRTRSSNLTRPSQAPSFHRHPSGSHALQQKNKDDSSWLVPAQTTPRVPKKAPLLTKPAVFDFTLDAHSSFFATSPQACSTPAPPSRASADPDPTPRPMILSSPRTSLSPAISIRSDSFDDSLFSKSSLSVSQAHVKRATTRLRSVSNSVVDDDATPLPKLRTRVHLSEDSIFSSALDFSMTVKQPLNNYKSTIATGKLPIDTEDTFSASPFSNAPNPSTVVDTSIASSSTLSRNVSKGDELGLLFSEMGLDDNGKWRSREIPAEETYPIPGGLTPAPRKNSTDGQTQRRRTSSVTSPKTNIIGQHRRFTRHTRKSSVHALLLPTIRMRIDDEPLVPEDSQDDELLLTSQNWDVIPN